MPLLEVNDLTTWFHMRDGIVRAVDGVSFTLDRGETLGIVGESGSGKSVSCYSLLDLIPKPPGRIERGTAVLGGEVDLLRAPREVLRRIRGKRIAMVFQDPMTSLNPYLRISTQMIEPLLIHEGLGNREALRRAIESLEEVGIHDAVRQIDLYPHQFSGGMRQRVMIAMALITHPEILIADEPTTALDVTVQAQILELIKARQRELGTAVIYVTHDLGVIAGVCDRVNVMYAGTIMESGTVDEIFYNSAHPYTQALQQSIPSLHDKGKSLYTIPGAPPDLTEERSGCPFAPRCAYEEAHCTGPNYRGLDAFRGRHKTACLRVLEGELNLKEENR